MQREDRAFQFEMKEMDIRSSQGQSSNNATRSVFDVTKYVKLIPPFQEDNVHKFFNHFEKLAVQLEWPEDKWSLLVQSVFIGKAQQIYSVLSIEESSDYDVVKKAVFNVYELVPEVYRKKFRSFKNKKVKHMLNLQEKKKIYLIDGVLHKK